MLPTLKQQGILVFILREHCHVDGIESLSDKIQMESDEPLSRQLRASINIKSPAVYIYTSGTTGNLEGLSGLVQRLSNWRSSGEKSDDDSNDWQDPMKTAQ